MKRLKSEPMHCYPIIKAVLISTLMMISPAKGDGTAECNTGSGTNSTECGENANATANTATAVGAFADATGASSISVGVLADATATNSTAVGVSSDANATDSTAVGRSSVASGIGSTAVGASAFARSEGAVSLGFAAGFNDSAVTDSPQAIAIGENSNIAAAAPGAIAIGGDVDGDNKGAEATAPGAIAIGADVVADIPNTLVTNVPIVAKDPSTTVAPRTMFEIAGAGNTKFNVNNTDANESWAFANPGTGFRLSRQGSGSVELEIKNNGNAVLAGTLTENSDVNTKHDVQVLDQQQILDKVMQLPISQWRYNDDPDSKHIGPMAQDFYQAFQLGHTDKGISTLDSSGVALAAIQALKIENEMLKAEKDNQMSALKHEKDSEIAQLREELAALKMMITSAAN